MKKKIAALTDSMKGTGALDPSPPLNRYLIWTLVIFIGLTNKPSLRALEKQFSSDFQLKIGLYFFTSFAKTTFMGVFYKKTWITQG
jgi:hypothetical protein